jgi:hypothetical protein
LTLLELIDRINFLKKIKVAYEREQQTDHPAYSQTCTELQQREAQQASGHYMPTQASQ